MALRPARVWTSSPICSSCTGRSPEGVQIFVPFKKQLFGVGLGGTVGVGAGAGAGLDTICADAVFLANARKGMLAALTVVTLSSCRRVRTYCELFMSRSQR